MFWRLSAKRLMTTKQKSLIFLYCVYLWREKTTVQPSHGEKEIKHMKKKKEKKILRRPCKGKKTNGKKWIGLLLSTMWEFLLRFSLLISFSLFISPTKNQLPTYKTTSSPSSPLFHPVEFSCIFYISANFQISYCISQIPDLSVRALVPCFRVSSKV